MNIPDLLLDAGNSYYVREIYTGYDHIDSNWTAAEMLSDAIPAFFDANGNGVMDDYETGDTADLDGNGTPDVNQDDIKCTRTVKGNGEVGVKAISGGMIIERIKTQDDALLADADNRPSSMPFGILSLRLRVQHPGDQASLRVFLPEPVSNGSRWYEYHPANLWQDYSDRIAFDSDRKSVSLQVTDGSIGDSDGVENGIVIHSSGPGKAAATSVADSSELAAQDGGGGGCFIASTTLSWLTK